VTVFRAGGVTFLDPAWMGWVPFLVPALTGWVPPFRRPPKRPMGSGAAGSAGLAVPNLKAGMLKPVFFSST